MMSKYIGAYSVVNFKYPSKVIKEAKSTILLTFEMKSPKLIWSVEQEI